MNIEDIFGLISERCTSNYIGTNFDDEQLLCEISTNWINECDNNSRNWVGRRDLINHLSQLLCSHVRILSLVGVSGIGKSSLALRLGCSSPLSETFSTLKIISFDTPKPSFDLFIQQIIGNQISFNSNISQHDLMEMAIEQLNAHPCLLILDAAEAIIEVDCRGNSRFWEPRFAYFFQRFLAKSEMRSRIIITSKIYPPSVLSASSNQDSKSQIEYIDGLTIDDALLIFEQHGINPTSAVEQFYLQRIINEYNGHPLALRVIAGEIIEPPYCGEISVYWFDCKPLYLSSITTTLEDHYQQANPDLITSNYSLMGNLSPINLAEKVIHLIEQSFERLLRYSALSALLLCMGATYRHSTERSAWLFLMNDYPEMIQISAFKTLQQRLFIQESYVEQKLLYNLHRMIREVAIDKLYQIIEAEIFPE